MKVRFYDRPLCYFCGRKAIQTHHIFGGFNRDQSEKYGCTVKLCVECHQKVHFSKDRTYMDKLRQECEKWFIKENNTDIDGFIKVFGRNYL